MRRYLADRAGVNEEREFFLLWVLGRDLPGAITIEPAKGDAWPDEASERNSEEARKAAKTHALRFSLAGVQLKFSAIREARGGLTIPATGVGGSWIAKLPSREFEGIPENEFAMMDLARRVGINVPQIQLIDVDAIGNPPEGIGKIGGNAFVIERFDRSPGAPIHMEDFAQVFGVYPHSKYKKASYRNIAEVLAAESGEADIAEFIRRLTFNTLIGNADMHLKNWSLIYPDQRSARLAPAYDFVSTIPYKADTEAALKFSRTKRFDAFTLDELSHLAAKARLPEKAVLETARETVERFQQAWAAEKRNLPQPKAVTAAIDDHLRKLPIAQ
jgi:serine/threonine-protein kinase HipA